MNHDNLTPTVKRILALADIEAKKNGDYTGVNHLVIGMMLEGENFGSMNMRGAGWTVETLRNLGALNTELDELRAKVGEAMFSSDPNKATVPLIEILKRDAALNIALSALEDIRTHAHCLAKAGPLNTPTLDKAWSRFMEIDAKAANAIGQVRAARDGN